jgi:hypothetical protein
LGQADGSFGTTGFTAIFQLFKHVSGRHIHISHAQQDINETMSLFDQMTQAGLNLPQTFRAMILLNDLPSESNTLASTIVQTLEVANFDINHISSCILMEMDLWATHKPLHAQISHAEFEGPFSLIKRTNVIRHGPPNQNQWQNQTPSYQRLSNQQQYKPPTGGYQNQQSGNCNPNQNQQKGKGPARSKQPGKGQKKEWFKKQQDNKGKAPARANEQVSFANEVQMEKGQVDEDLASRFIDHLENQEMDDTTSASSIQAFARWGDRDDDEDNRMNVAGPSRQPF